MESFFTYIAVRFALFILRMIPRRVCSSVLNLLASLVFRIDTRHRHIALVNLRIAFPELPLSRRREIAERSFQITAQNLLEISRLTSLNVQNISSIAEYDSVNGLNNFEAAVARGKPILYLTGHFSSWELLPTAHALFGHPLSFLTRPLDNSALENYLLNIRQAAGNVVISKKNAVRQVLKTLKASGSVGMLLDQNTDPTEAVFVDFFGLPAATNMSMALLALRTDATVLPGYLTPMHQGRYRIKFLPPLELIRTGDMNRDIVENTRMLNRVLEGIVCEQPEAWLWGHKRWHYQEFEPPGKIYRLSEVEIEAYLRRKCGGERSVSQFP